MEFEKQLNTEKKNKLRTNIGGVIFIILMGLVILEYISYSFLMMLSIPMMAIIIGWNSISDGKNENNKNRVLILAFFLIFISWNFYSLQIENANNARIIHILCSDKISDSMLCDKINSILTSNEDD